jgi:NADPH:quinone reductase-like Zn-dependent oxidoreductase
MRAFALQARDSAAAVHDLPDRDPGPGEVRLNVEAASVNGFDVTVAAGYVWDMLPHDFPVVLGRDVAGTVESVGADVQGVAVGDRVASVIHGMGLNAHGTFAERFIAAAADVVPVPDGVTATQAVAAGLAAIAALDAVDALDVQPGDVVLVSGATGGVGTVALQLAAARGATVLATARPGEGSDLVRRLGAHEVVDFTTDLAAAVTAAAPGGVTKALHAAGDPAALAALLVPGGVLASLIGADQSHLGRDDVTAEPVTAQATPEKLASLLQAIAARRLEVVESTSRSLDDAAAALAAFGAGKIGKIVVTIP